MKRFNIDIRLIAARLEQLCASFKQSSKQVFAARRLESMKPVVRPMQRTQITQPAAPAEARLPTLQTS